MDVRFFDSLFEGDSANGIKLSMGLTGGDFWPRLGGCQTLYRGESVEAIDFSTILVVTDAASKSVAVPNYIQHASGSIYYYIIRRVNKCGQQEQTLLAAIKAAMDSNGNLAKPKPNKVFWLMANQVAPSVAELLWYYWPIGQKSIPASFNVYWDNGTGQIDYGNTVAVIEYSGKRFYSYQSNTLIAGRYKFAVSAEGLDGVESDNIQLAIQINTVNPELVEILRADVI